MMHRLIITHRSGEPKLGHEVQYYLACWHRNGWAGLWNKTPWWQWRKRQRRFDGWMRAIQRFHEHGQDVTYEA